MFKRLKLCLFALLLVALGRMEASVVIKIRTAPFTYRQVTFSKEYFNEFYNNCLCDNRKTCTAEYYIHGLYRYVNKVVPGDSDNTGDSGRVIYYYCYHGGSQTITCEKSRGNVGGYHDWYEVRETDCHYSCLVFIWYYSGEWIDFSNSELNVQRCYGSSCNCPVPTTTPIIQTTTEKASTTTTSTTTTTTTRPKSTTATSVTTESVDSTSAAAVPNSANDSNDDPQLSVIIGVVFAAIFIVIVIAVISFIFWRRKRRHRTSKPNNGIQSSIALNELNSNVYSTPENSLTGTHNNVASVSNNYSEIDGNKPGVSSDNDHDKFAKAIYQNSANETKSSFATPKNGNKKMPQTLTVTELKGKKTLPAGSGQTQTKSGSVPGNDQEGIAMTSSQDVEYGYSTVQDQSIEHDDYHTAPLTQYDYATVKSSKNKDTGYEYAGPHDVHVTDTANKSSIENVDGSTYSTAGTINHSINSPSANHTKDIYSRLHEERTQTNNPYNTLPQPDEEVHNSQTNTGSLAAQPKNVYSRLHEENRQMQNPYNMLLQPSEDAYISQTANQPSRYSFAQPISGRVSNEKTDSSEETSKDVTSQNHTYYVLEGGEENGETTTKKQNTYFELEKQENFSDSDTGEA